jgi:hypothetical protein
MTMIESAIQDVAGRFGLGPKAGAGTDGIGAGSKTVGAGAVATTATIRS